MGNIREEFESMDQESEMKKDRFKLKPENQHQVKAHFIGYLYVYCPDKGFTLKQVASTFKISIKDVQYHYKRDKEKLNERGIYLDESEKQFYRKEWRFKSNYTGKFEKSSI